MLLRTLSLTFLLCLSSLSYAETATRLRIITTSDLHGHLMDFDYYKDRQTAAQGLARTATLIRLAQVGSDNSVLVDNGDLLQGSPMAEWASKQTFTHQTGAHPAYGAMRMLKFNAANLGNHDFNYGLDFLQENIKLADFPVINANVYHLDSAGKRTTHVFTPWTIERKLVRDISGVEREINIGYIGFTPPQIMQWDKNNLAGKVTARDILASAEEELPKLKAAGADIIIAIAHSGLDTKTFAEGMENTVYYLARNKLIDAIAFGHEHALFPSEDYAGIEGINIKKGTIFGTPAVMPNKFGTHIGVIDLTLKWIDNEWKITDSKTQTRGLKREDGKRIVPYMSMRQYLQPMHEATQEFVSQPIGRSAIPFHSYFALIQDTSAVEIVNLAQLDYAKKWQQESDYKSLPLVSAAAPFKAGGKGDSPDDYTEVNRGVMSLRNAADLYLYANELVILKLRTSELKEWLECTAAQYKQIDSSEVAPQDIINWKFRTFNFDIFQGLDYHYDIHVPSRYNESCKLVNPNAERVTLDLINGQPATEVDEVLVVTNNFRAYGGGNFAGASEENIVYHSPNTNREILIKYIADWPGGEVDFQPDYNWGFSSIPALVKLTASTESSPAARPTISEPVAGALDLKYVERADSGFSIYQFKLLSHEPDLHLDIKSDVDFEIKTPEIKEIEVKSDNTERHIQLPGEAVLDDVKAIIHVEDETEIENDDELLYEEQSDEQ